MSPARKPKWTEQQRELMRELYPLGAIDELVERTGRSRQAVKHAAITMGLAGRYHWRGTACAIGTEVHRRGLNSYVMVKVLDASCKPVWVRKHHLVWQSHTGSLPPKGMRLVFKDGQRANCAFENLELVPPAESARRMTRIRTAFPPELQESISLLNRIRKLLREHKEHKRRPGASVSHAR